MNDRAFHVYIMASASKNLYVGMTSEIRRRVSEHRSGTRSGFTQTYNVNRLVHAERFTDARDAVRRERQLKGWLRKRKVALIEAGNPEWEDLAEGWSVDTDRRSPQLKDPSLRSG